LNLIHGLTAIASSELGAILLFFGFWVGLWLPLALPLAIALQWRPGQPTQPSQKIPLVLTLYALAPLALWGITTLTATPWTQYGWALNGQLLRSMLIGGAVGSLSFAGIYALQWAWGWLQVSKRVSNPEALIDLGILRTLGLTLGLAGAIGAVEELIFRGFLFQELGDAWGLMPGAIASSVIFALLHLVWEGRAGLGSLPGLFLMGIVLVLARWVDGGQLGLAWGLHAGWVWVAANLESLPELQGTGKVPRWVTGVPDQPLASGIGLGYMTVLCFGLYGLGRYGFGLSNWGL
jgi:membrane protease YdiL (CAAX protease family)